MTDYLELLSQENERALLELEQRLERALSGVWSAMGPGEALPVTGVHSESEVEFVETDMAELPGAEMWTWAERPVEATERQWRDETAERPSALLTEIQRMDQVIQAGSRVQAERAFMAWRTESAGTGGNRRNWPAAFLRGGRQGDAAVMPGPERQSVPTTWPGRGRSGVQSEAARDWAEQADRVFRRDSRRYDGGFYLY